MAELVCNDCNLGLKFFTKEELDNHQRKFCVSSNYTNVQALNDRLHNLRNEPVKNNSVLASVTKNMLQNDTSFYQQTSDPNKNIYGMIREMQQSKDQELQYKIEKQEIERAVKNQSRDALGDMGVAKKREVEELGQ